MSTADASSYTIPFTSNSSLKTGFHLYAALGGGSPHLFEVDTGSVGILVPRKVLGPSYQDFDPAQDIQFQYSSSGKVYSGQWVSLPVVLGVPVDWDGTGDYPTALVEVFAVDQPMQFDGGMLGIGFAIGGTADGGPLRNPLLRLNFQGTALSAGYIVRTTSIEVGLTSTNLAGFAFIGLERNAAGTDWRSRSEASACRAVSSSSCRCLSIQASARCCCGWMSPTGHPHWRNTRSFPRASP